MRQERFLDDFAPISLEETNRRASLLRRVDTKYVIRPDQLDWVLAHWKNSHQILEIDGNRIFHYHSVYYDTPALDLYHAHHSGAASRVKFRTREYTDSQQAYYEIKNRANTGVTDKQRIRVRALDQLPPLLTEASKQYPRRLGGQSIGEVLQVDYDRITLVSREGGERITVDLNLSYRAAGKVEHYPDRVIIEIKHARGVRTRERDLFRSLGIRPGSISKYCLGILSLYPNVKKNRFKLPLRILAKQLTDHGAAASTG